MRLPLSSVISFVTRLPVCRVTLGWRSAGSIEARLGVSLRIDAAGKGVAGAAAHALAARMKINRSRHVEGLQAAAAKRSNRSASRGSCGIGGKG